MLLHQLEYVTFISEVQAQLEFSLSLPHAPSEAT